MSQNCSFLDPESPSLVCNIKHYNTKTKFISCKLKPQQIKGQSSHFELIFQQKKKKIKNTRIRAVCSCPASKSCARSRRICFTWISFLFLISFILDIASFSDVLLQSKQQSSAKKPSNNPKT